MLKALLIKKKLDEKRAALQALQAKDAAFSTREAELAASITEVTEETSAEERSALEDLVNTFEAERTAHTNAKTALEEEIRGLENDLAAEEAAQDTTPNPAPAPATNERKDNVTMNTRSKIFSRMSAQERDAMFARTEVKDWLGEFRSALKQKRAINNIGLTIPTVFLGVLRENIMEFSKLYKHVTVRPVAGNGRELIMGNWTEAIWADCCAAIDEASLTFNDMEFGCWRVAAYYAVCNADLEDSDIDLAAEILTALGQGIGQALDKAILYGTGARMPLGIVTRLVQTEAPSDYPATARAWEDLSQTHVLSLPDDLADADLFKALTLAAGAVKGKYSRGQKVWCVNEATRTYLVANALTINANGVIVSAINDTLPVIGGVLEVLDFLPDDVIVGGYMDLYILVERAGARFATSEHVRFLQDQTIMKGTARYDGQPLGEGFVVIGLRGKTPSAADVTFPAA